MSPLRSTVRHSVPYLLFALSIVLGIAEVLMPWARVTAHPTSGAMYELAYNEDPPPLEREIIATVPFWKPIPDVSGCFPSTIDWASDYDDRYERTGFILYTLQIASWLCFFVVRRKDDARIYWRAIKYSLVFLCLFSIGCIIATLLGPVTSCSPPPGIYIEQAKPLWPAFATSVVSLGLVIFGMLLPSPQGNKADKTI